MNHQLKPIQEQVAVVMGASSGIGRITALKLARHGAKVVVSARSQQGLDSLVQQIQGFGGEAHAVVADTMHFDQVQQVADAAVQRFGRIDTWVHTAAVAVYATVEQTKPEEYKQVLEVNLLGQIYGAKAALPHLRHEGRGALIHISSVESKVSLPYHSAYAASKHGIAGFVDALRLELAHDSIPISVTNILPASINTPFFNKALTRLGVQPKGVPPIYEPEQVADAIVYAAQHPVRDYIVGGAGKAMVFGQSLSPKLMDAYLLSSTFDSQRSAIPKGETAPNNLFGAIDDFNQIWGNQNDPALSPPKQQKSWLQILPEQWGISQQTTDQAQEDNQPYWGEQRQDRSSRGLGQLTSRFASSGVNMALAGLALGAAAAAIYQSTNDGKARSRPQNLTGDNCGYPAAEGNRAPRQWQSQSYNQQAMRSGQTHGQQFARTGESDISDPSEIADAHVDDYMAEEVVILEPVPGLEEDTRETQTI